MQNASFEAEIVRLKKMPLESEKVRLLSAAVLPGLTRIIDREEISEMRRGLLRLAIAVAKDGEGAIEKLPQPGSGKVTFQKIEGGFELEGKHLESDKVETLRIGPPLKKEKDDKK